MPRTYSFDHFQVPSSEPKSRSQRRKDKQHVSGSSEEAQGPQPPGEIHYGHSHAETEQLFKAHARERQRMTEGSVEQAGAKFAHGRPVRELRPEAPPARKEKAGTRSTHPIGSLPKTEEPPPHARFQDVLEEASRQLQVLQSGVEDVTRAVSRLAALPLEVLRIAARRLRLVHG